MGINFKNGLYISGNFSVFDDKYGGYVCYIDIPIQIAIAVIRYQLRLLAEDGYFPIAEDDVPHNNWWWGWKDEKAKEYMSISELSTVYATIIKIHLEKFLKDFRNGHNYMVKTDSYGYDGDPLMRILEIDSARKIQRRWLYYYQLNIIRSKYPQ